MQIQLGSWVFDVDISLNMQITAQQAKEHCTCGYCRNYYAAIDGAYPALRRFLSDFGIHVEGPDELCPFEATIYEASYIVNGSILHSSQEKIFIDSVPVRVLSSMEADMDTIRPEPYFVLVIGLIELPWLLDEPADQVVSPANEECYLQRMQDKLLKRAAAEDLYS